MRAMQARRIGRSIILPGMASLLMKLFLPSMPIFSEPFCRKIPEHLETIRVLNHPRYREHCTSNRLLCNNDSLLVMIIECIGEGKRWEHGGLPCSNGAGDAVLGLEWLRVDSLRIAVVKTADSIVSDALLYEHNGKRLAISGWNVYYDLPETPRTIWVEVVGQDREQIARMWWHILRYMGIDTLTKTAEEPSPQVLPAKSFYDAERGLASLWLTSHIEQRVVIRFVDKVSAQTRGTEFIRRDTLDLKPGHTLYTRPWNGKDNWGYFFVYTDEERLSVPLNVSQETREDSSSRRDATSTTPQRPDGRPRPGGGEGSRDEEGSPLVSRGDEAD